MGLIKKITYSGIILLAFLVSTIHSFGQQDPMYTQYMDNLQIINPGFAGSKETGNILLVARNQWVGFDGAPKTRTFAYHTPVNDHKIGVGFSILSDKIGPLTQTGVYFDYSYFLRVGYNYKLSMGLKGGFSFYRANLSELQTVSPDPIYARDIYKNFLPNFGVGAFLFSDDNYFGASIPKLVENIINREEYSTQYISKEQIHLYLVAGKKFRLTEGVQLKTHSMVKLVKNAPTSIDLTALFGFSEKFWVGGMYRLGDSYGIIAQFNVADKMLIGYSYDLTYSVLNAFSSGTHEIMFSYNLDLFDRKPKKTK
jgi:type IX secretion system PorP/SprF family membrane protein